MTFERATLILLLMMLLMSPLWGGALLWFSAKRVAGRPFGYWRCCVANLISGSLLAVLAAVAALILVWMGKTGNDAIVGTMMLLVFVAGFVIHRRVVSALFDIDGLQAVIVVVYQTMLAVAFLGSLALLWYALFIVIDAFSFPGD